MSQNIIAQEVRTYIFRRIRVFFLTLAHHGINCIFYDLKMNATGFTSGINVIVSINYISASGFSQGAGLMYAAVAPPHRTFAVKLTGPPHWGTRADSSCRRSPHCRVVKLTAADSMNDHSHGQQKHRL